MNEDDKVRAQQLRALRAPYAFVPLGAKPRDGTQRFRGPAVWLARIRSPLSPRSMRLGYEHPTVQCDRRRPDDPCACCKSVTLTNEDQSQIRMPFPRGSRRWFASYYRRMGIESAFGGLKSYVLHLRRGYFRIFGLTAHRLLLEFTLAAMNVVTLRSRHLERDLPDPWGQLLGEPDPRHTTSRRRGSRSTGVTSGEGRGERESASAHQPI
ncbi:hypothetical protein [Rhodococcus sp. NPDC059234]|uniref:hypothetical protein n=1 Tax=Rhodococcus sp. NPDC059234 TaxID=3346781 RepID=UPI003670FA60